MQKETSANILGVVCRRNRPRLPSLAELVQGLAVSANTDGSKQRRGLRKAES
jgi:hypothetical protein